MMKQSSRNVWASILIVCSMMAIILSNEFLFNSHPPKWLFFVISIVLSALGYTLGRLFPAGEYSKIQTINLSTPPSQSLKTPDHA